MRDLKFRAWSTKLNKFLSIGFHMVGETTLFDLLNQHTLSELDTIHVTQYVNLNDEDGKEIYDGDLVSNVYDDQIGKVYYASEMGAYRILLPDSRSIPIVTLRLVDGQPQGFIRCVKKVTGNIFEFQQTS